MVWGDNFKILELKIKAVPLIISILMHIGIFLVLVAVNYYKETYSGESVLMVELTSRESGGNLHVIQEGAKFQGSKKPMGKIDGQSENPDSFPFTQEHKPAFQKGEEETKTMIAYEQHLSSKDNEQSLLSKLDSNPSVSSGVRGYIGATQTAGTSGYEKKQTIPGLGKEAIEGEFGSINGPSFLEMVKPEYPLLARRLGKEGRVVLRLFIDEYGRLANVEIVERAGYGFDDAAIKAVRVSTFIPAKINGKPISCSALLPVRFKLKGED